MPTHHLPLYAHGGLPNASSVTPLSALPLWVVVIALLLAPFLLELFLLELPLFEPFFDPLCDEDDDEDAAPLFDAFFFDAFFPTPSILPCTFRLGG